MSAELDKGSLKDFMADASESEITTQLRKHRLDLLRVEALRLAVDLYKSMRASSGGDSIVSRAREFYDFLKEGID